MSGSDAGDYTIAYGMCFDCDTGLYITMSVRSKTGPTTKTIILPFDLFGRNKTMTAQIIYHHLYRTNNYGAGSVISRNLTRISFYAARRAGRCLSPSQIRLIIDSPALDTHEKAIDESSQKITFP